MYSSATNMSEHMLLGYVAQPNLVPQTHTNNWMTGGTPPEDGALGNHL